MLFCVFDVFTIFHIDVNSTTPYSNIHFGLVIHSYFFLNLWYNLEKFKNLTRFNFMNTFMPGAKKINLPEDSLGKLIEGGHKLTVISHDKPDDY